MSKAECGRLIALLNKLQSEAPCMGLRCVGCQICGYGISGSYGTQCAIDVVREQADSKRDK